MFSTAAATYQPITEVIFGSALCLWIKIRKRVFQQSETLPSGARLTDSSATFKRQLKTTPLTVFLSSRDSAIAYYSSDQAPLNLQCSWPTAPALCWTSPCQTDHIRVTHVHSSTLAQPSGTHFLSISQTVISLAPTSKPLSKIFRVLLLPANSAQLKFVTK